MMCLGEKLRWTTQKGTAIHREDFNYVVPLNVCELMKAPSLGLCVIVCRILIMRV